MSPMNDINLFLGISLWKFLAIVPDLKLYQKLIKGLISSLCVAQIGEAIDERNNLF